MKKIVFFFTVLLLCVFSPQFLYANSSFIDFSVLKGDKIKNASIDVATWTNVANKVTNKWLRFLYTIKIVISGGLLVYLVYSGMMMVISMGRDEGKLSEAKRSLRYAILALFFINIPGTLYSAFYSEGINVASVWGEISKGNFTSEINSGSNLFFNNVRFFGTFDKIVFFLEVLVASIAMISIVFSGLRIITARGEDDKVSSAKQRILWSLAGLVFLGIMQLWKYVIYTGDFRDKGQTLYSSMINLAIYFGGAVALFFISMAGYYYVTAAWEEDRINKAKSILLNTLLGVVILLGTYTLLNDLSTLNF